MSDPVGFDYSAGTPWMLTGRIEDAVDAAEREDRSVREAIVREVTRQFREDPRYRRAFRDRYLDAGVDVTSVTVAGTGRREGIAAWQGRCDAGEEFRKVTAPAEARAVADADAVGVLLNTQNLGRAVDGDVEGVEALYDAGVRIFQPTYNLQNGLGAGCYERVDAGLSKAGVAAVDRLNDLGGVVDCSHCGRATTLDAVEVSADPVACTHVACEAVAEHPRAKSDEVLRAVADADGYVGVVGVPWFLAPDEDDPAIEVFFEHLDHAIDVVGADRVGIGSDFGNVDAGAPDAYVAEARRGAVAAGFPEGYGEGYGGGFGQVQRFADWGDVRTEIRRRYDEEVARGILGDNFLAFWERVVGG